jgi:hypothetical protein
MLIQTRGLDSVRRFNVGRVLDPNPNTPPRRRRRKMRTRRRRTGGRRRRRSATSVKCFLSHPPALASVETCTPKRPVSA